jgi:hypothetical protein
MQAWGFDGDLDPEPAQAHAIPPCQTVDHAEGGLLLVPYASQCSWDPALKVTVERLDDMDQPWVYFDGNVPTTVRLQQVDSTIVTRAWDKNGVMLYAVPSTSGRGIRGCIACLSGLRSSTVV